MISMIIDFVMEQMDGFSLYKEIRKIDNKVKVCFITAFEEHWLASTSKYRSCATPQRKISVLTGEIPRDTSFEKGFPFQYVENDNESVTHTVPCHCTGWKATNRIIEIFPEKIYKNSWIYLKQPPHVLVVKCVHLYTCLL